MHVCVSHITVLENEMNSVIVPPSSLHQDFGEMLNDVEGATSCSVPTDVSWLSTLRCLERSSLVK